jgi:hypothetical protein
MTPAETVVAFHEALNGHDNAAFDHVAEDLIQHAAGPQGRDGLRETLATLERDLGRPTATIHRVVAEDDLVVVHLTMNGRHVASTMPLLAGLHRRATPSLGLHPHLASRRRPDRRALGVPRRCRTPRAGRRLAAAVTGTRHRAGQLRASIRSAFSCHLRRDLRPGRGGRGECRRPVAQQFDITDG